MIIMHLEDCTLVVVHIFPKLLEYATLRKTEILKGGAGAFKFVNQPHTLKLFSIWKKFNVVYIEER